MLPTIDPNQIPLGFDYQWASLAVNGDEKLGDYHRMREGGWRPVPYSRHPEVENYFSLRMTFSPEGDHTIEERIVCGGLILVERPKILTTQSRAVEKLEADTPIEILRQNHPTPHMMPRPSTNAFHWWPRLKFQLRRPAVWLAKKWWVWFRG